MKVTFEGSVSTILGEMDSFRGQCRSPDVALGPDLGDMVLPVKRVEVVAEEPAVKKAEAHRTVVGQSLAVRVKHLCEEERITVSELERALGFGNAVVRQWRVDVDPGVFRVRRVANFFGLSVDELLNGL